MDIFALPRPLCVLVVDDSRDQADSLALLLRHWGYHPVVAYDGIAALAIARTCRPDIVLLDIALPHLDGYAVARQLRTEPNLSRVRLLAVTGHGRDEDRQRAREAGFDHHLLKPVDPEHLRCLLAELAANAAAGAAVPPEQGEREGPASPGSRACG